MCGIAGLLLTDPGSIAEPKHAVQRMTARLSHRGPDGEQVWSEGSVHLGHRRLSVIDIAGGSQPMIGPSGAVVVYNGEIYNYLELRRELIERGRQFRTNSDTEVLLAAYEVWGADCVSKFRGMFAFAIWDPSRQDLFLGRDRLGKKPLYVVEGKGFFAFASELKGLTALEAVRQSAELDLEALSDFLSLGYVLSPKTIFKSIRKLPAGHVAFVSASDGRLVARPYWKIEDQFLADKHQDRKAALERFRELLDESVKLRLQADVPVGCFLSGGLDSSAITQAVALGSEKEVTPFCVGFDDRRFDETPHALAVTRHLGLELKSIKQEPLGPAMLATVLEHTDEPFADTSSVPTYHLNQEARRHVVVALSGDGADEILAGYPTLRADQLFAFYGRLPRWVHTLSSGLAGRLLRPSYGKVSWDYKIRQFLSAGGLSPERAHYHWREIFSAEEKAQMLRPEVTEALAGYDPYQCFADAFDRVGGAGFIDRALCVDIQTWLQDDILVKIDRMSQAHGLEVRSPFLDHHLVEFCARLPETWKINGRRQKVLLKDAMRGRLPRKTISRRKEGFNMPVADDGRARCLAPDGASEFLNDAFRLDPEREDVTFKSFALEILNIWADEFRALRESRETT